MSIGIFFAHPLSGSLGSTRRVSEIAFTLAAKLGVEVNIYSPYEKRSFLAPNVGLRPIPNLTMSLGLSDISYRLSRFIYYNRYFARRFLMFIVKKSPKLLTDNLVNTLKSDNVAVLQAEQDVAILPAVLAARKLGLPIIADLHNITAEELVAAGVLRKGEKTYDQLQGFVRGNLEKVEYVCVVNEYLADYVSREYNVEKRRILVVPPAANSGIIRSEDDNERLRVVYSGMVTYREHVDLAVESMSQVLRSFPRARFFVTSKGEALKRVKRFAKKLKVPIDFFWFPNQKDFFRFLSTCSVGVLPSSNDEARRLGTPIKLFDYLSAGLPVVANDVGGWCEIITREKVGLLTRDDPGHFGSAVESLLKDSELRSRMSSNALNAVGRKYNWDNSIKPLLRKYQSLVSGN